jgi:hypothetical protein
MLGGRGCGTVSTRENSKLVGGCIFSSIFAFLWSVQERSLQDLCAFVHQIKELFFSSNTSQFWCEKKTVFSILVSQFEFNSLFGNSTIFAARQQNKLL